MLSLDIVDIALILSGGAEAGRCLSLLPGGIAELTGRSHSGFDDERIHF